MIIEKMTISDFNKIKDNLEKDFDDFWNANILENEILNNLYFVAKENSEILGFAGVRIVLDEADIMNVVVRKDKRRLGIGKALLEKIIKILNCKVINLEVNEKNIAAINLYKSLGFKQSGIRKSYYNGTESALLFTMNIN